MENLFESKLRYLCGPTQLYFFKDLPGNRKLLILGEKHDNPYLRCQSDNCLNIWEYVLNLSYLSDKECIDLFIENPYHAFRSDKLLFGGGLNYSRRVFIETCGIHYDACENLRIHYFDTRQILTNRNLLFRETDYDLPEKYNEYFKKHTNMFYHPLSSNLLEDYSIEDNMCIEATKILMGKNYEDFIDNIYNIYLNVIGINIPSFWDTNRSRLRFSDKSVLGKLTKLGLFDYPINIGYEYNYRKFIPKITLFVANKIQKEINKMDTLIDKNRFIEIYFECWLEQQKKNGVMDESIIKLIRECLDNDKDKNKSNNIISFFTTLLDDIGLFVTDIYLLSRVFIRFNKKRRYYYNCPQQEYTKNIIIYSGEAHSILYNSFISKYFKTKPEFNIIQKSNKKCMDFKKEIQFF